MTFTFKNTDQVTAAVNTLIFVYENWQRKLDEDLYPYVHVKESNWSYEVTFGYVTGHRVKVDPDVGILSTAIYMEEKIKFPKSESALERLDTWLTELLDRVSRMKIKMEY